MIISNHWQGFLFLACYLIHFSAFGQTVSNTAGPRLESEFKLAVPPEQEDQLWQFVKDRFSTKNMALTDTSYRSEMQSEKFIDLYFDSEKFILYQNEAGIRYRRRYHKDSLIKDLVQLKLPAGDEAGVVRQEIKFEPYSIKKRKDRKAEHPFWKYIHPDDRAEVNLYLAGYDLSGDQLAPSLKIKQNRRRVYITDDEGPVMTLTIDKVNYAYFPYMRFTELELELNEIRYTNASQEEKLKMENLNKGIKAQITSAFPDLLQDQTPKYNKMKDKVDRSTLAAIYSNLMFILLGILVICTVFSGFRHFK